MKIIPPNPPLWKRGAGGILKGGWGDFQAKRPVFVLLILLAAVSCAPLSGIVERPGYEIKVLEDEIRVQLDNRKEAMSGFMAEADVNLKYPGVDYRGRVLIMGQEPSSLRLDSIGPFNQPVLSFATDGEHFALISILAMRYYDGDLASPTIAFFIPNGVKMQDIYCWFLGAYDFKDRYLISCSRHTLNPSCLIMELSNKRTGLREEVWIESAEGIVRRLVLKDVGGNLILIAESDGLTKNGEFSYPEMVRFSLPSSGLSLSMVYKKVRFLSSVPSIAFSLNCPPGFEHKTFN